MIYELIEDSLISKLEKGLQLPEYLILKQDTYDEMVSELTAMGRNTGKIVVRLDNVEVELLRGENPTELVH